MSTEAKGKERGKPANIQRDAYFKMRPYGDAAMVRLKAGDARKKLRMLIIARARELEIRFEGESVDEEFFAKWLEGRGKDGKITYLRIPDFCEHAGTAQRLSLPTPMDDIRLIVKKAANGDVSFFLNGADLEKAEASPLPERTYILVHKIGEKTIGYTIKEFLLRVNSDFVFLDIEIAS